MLIIVLERTKSAENCVGEAIPNGQFPLRGYNQTESRDEKEVGHEDIVGGYSSPFH